MKCYENAIQRRIQNLSIRLSLLAGDTLKLIHIGGADGGPDDGQMIYLGHVLPAVIVLYKKYSLILFQRFLGIYSSPKSVAY